MLIEKLFQLDLQQCFSKFVFLLSFGFVYNLSSTFEHQCFWTHSSGSLLSTGYWGLSASEWEDTPVSSSSSWKCISWWDRLGSSPLALVNLNRTFCAVTEITLCLWENRRYVNRRARASLCKEMGQDSPNQQVLKNAL